MTSVTLDSCRALGGGLLARAVKDVNARPRG